jgi:hypothetical protein
MYTLVGIHAPTMRVSKQIRYRMCRLNEQSAMYKQWEAAALNDSPDGAASPLLSSRMFFSRNRGYPTALLSVIPYDNVQEKARQERKRAEVSHWLRIYKQPVRDWRGVSYKSHFQSSGDNEEDNEEDDSDINNNNSNDNSSNANTNFSFTNNSNTSNNSNIHGSSGKNNSTPSKSLYGDHEKGECFRHDPSLLDDPDMTQGKHRYILRGDAATGPVMTSVIIIIIIIIVSSSPLKHCCVIFR